MPSLKNKMIFSLKIFAASLFEYKFHLHPQFECKCSEEEKSQKVNFEKIPC